MTDAEIISEFERREKAANKTVFGADHPQILADVAKEAGRPLEDVREVIRNSTFTGAN